MINYKVGDLVYLDKFHRGGLEIVEVHKDHVIVGKNSRVLLMKNMIKPYKERLEVKKWQ
jgi:hypothetical protein